MVKKLFKYEFSHFIKSLFPFFMIVPVSALLNRLIQFFETDSGVYHTVYYSSVFLFVVAIILSIVMVYVTAISRYYKNLFSTQGYLTMTLPVSESSHIFVKLSTAVCFIAVWAINTVVSLCILLAGENLIEVTKVIIYYFKRFFEIFGFEGGIYLFEAFLCAVAFLVYNIFVYYSCISIGHLAKKNRVLASFGVYFAYYIARQLLGTMFVIFMMVADNIFVDIVNFLLSHMHLSLWLFIIGFGLLCCLLFTINKGIMKNRLNLE